MVVIAIFLGLLQVYIFWQLPLWGMNIVALLPLLFSLREDGRYAELLLASSIFGIVTSVFVQPVTGLVLMLASILASAVTIAGYRVAMSSRFKKIMARGRHIYFAMTFSTLYLGILSLQYVTNYSFAQLAGSLLATILLHVLLLILVDITPLRRRQTEALL